MNTTPLTPPPIEPQPTPPAPVRARQGWITPVLAIVGSIALIGVLASAVFVGIRMFNTGSSGESADVQGVTELEIDSSAADFTLEYGAVTEAYLEVQGSRGWRIERDGDTLRVRPPRSFFGFWGFGGEQRVTLTLPTALKSQGLDADFEVSSGRFTAEGDFGELSLKVNAGHADVRGSATELDVTVNAGRADVDVRDVSEAEFEINAGRIDGVLSGATPNAIGIDVRAGELNLEVPDDTYNVSSNISAGSFDANGLQTASASRHTIDVNVSAGSATVRPGS